MCKNDIFPRNIGLEKTKDNIFLRSKLNWIGMMVEVVIRERTINTEILRQFIRFLFKITHCLEGRITL